MLVSQRRSVVAERLRSEGRVVVKDLAGELGVGEDTLRRDLRDLAEAGLCQRVYGGAILASPAVVDYRARQDVAAESKRRVGQLAARLIAPKSTVILDGGTTALEVARALPPDLRATVVTHSPTVAAALVSHPSIELYMLGGRIFKHSAVACGPSAVEAAQAINADLFLLGVTGVHPEAGLTTGDGEEAAMKRALSRRAAETYVLASVEKLGTASRFGVLPLEQITGVVTDAQADEPIVAALREAGVEVLDRDSPIERR